MVALKLIPQVLSWAAIVLVLARGTGRRRLSAASALAGFAVGVAVALVLFQNFRGETPFSLIRDVIGASFLLLLGVSVAALYRSTGERSSGLRWDAVVASPVVAGAEAAWAGLLAGGISAARVLGTEGGVVAIALLAVAAVACAAAAAFAEKHLPEQFAVSRAGMTAAVVALVLFSSSSIIRLDLFSPLTMKVMKFTHDFVHQFFESMLIPDHLFLKSYLWGYIGLLFSKEVGFWGGLLIWFLPIVLVLFAVGLEPLPMVSHIRQGAQRRKLVAAAIKSRRLKLFFPVLAALILCGAAYRSRNPSVEYWDPKPVLVTPSPSGEIFIPRKGEIDLEDGKIHKYLVRQGGRDVRFFVLISPATGHFTVDLDACAICKPDGYGQAEGTVICYYCKTLIPLETVGKPGGCNPVPVAFSEKADGVHLDAVSLGNAWRSTVQSTTGKKEEK